MCIKQFIKFSTARKFIVRCTPDKYLTRVLGKNVEFLSMYV